MEAVADEVCRADVQLLTLTGPGGVGKTRLALAAAERAVPHFADGVVFVDLAPLRAAHLVPAAIARHLGMDERDPVPLPERLAAALGRRQQLLVLDNFEHLLPARTGVLALLVACPRLVVLATSRAPLRVRGEREYRIAPLEVPTEATEWSPATALFLDRARAAGADLGSDPETLALVAEICRRLDGLPLAIELAAAWARLLPLDSLRSRLERRLPLLVDGPRDLPDRQRTMRDTIAWSYDLLAPVEQRQFRGLCLFVGGFTLEAAEALVSEDDLSDGLLELAALVDRSLLLRQPAPEPRFVILETLREFGMERLATLGESDAASRRHAAYFLALAERALRDAAGPAWAARLEREHGNLRAALAWALAAGEPEIALRLTAVLWRFWNERGYLGEGRHWLRDALDLAAGSSGIDPHTRLDALIGAATLAVDQGAYDEAETRTLEAVSLARVSGRASGLAAALTTHGLVARERGQYEAAARHYEEAGAIARAAGDRLGEGVALAGLGYVRLFEGDLADGVATAERGVAVLRAAGSTRELASALLSLAAHLSHTGAHVQAEALGCGGPHPVPDPRRYGKGGRGPVDPWPRDAVSG